MEIQKAIESFLENNNCSSTLALFKNQFRRNKINTAQLNIPNNPNINHQKFSHMIQSLPKLAIIKDHTQIFRQYAQTAQPKYLKKTLQRIKKHPQNLSKNNYHKLINLKFFKQLVQKENENINKVRQHLDAKEIEHPLDQSIIQENEWTGPDQVGYEIYEIPISEFGKACKEISAIKKYEQTGIKFVEYPQSYYIRLNQSRSKPQTNFHDNLPTRLPPKAKLHFEQKSLSSSYPIQFNGIVYDSYDLKVIYDRQKTGFQQERDIKIVINEVLAGKYQIVSVLGQAQFSKAIEVVDLQSKDEKPKRYCLKIIKNNKDYFDQSLDQIKLLRYIQANCNPQQSHIIALHDYFYHKEHLMILTQLLKDNLYDAYRLHPEYFSIANTQSIAKQIVIALEKIHSLNVIHTDLKPQNILIKSYSKKIVKVIDFGSSVFLHDTPSFYVQTRSYRAPQIILGCPYDEKIDMWSLGCILAEIFTGEVLFESDTAAGLLAKIQGLRGPWPSWMIQKGKYVQKYFSKQMIIFEQIKDSENKLGQPVVNIKTKMNQIRIYTPKTTNLKSRLRCQDQYFLDFLSKCLKIDPSTRMSAKQALKHPFINKVLPQN